MLGLRTKTEPASVVLEVAPAVREWCSIHHSVTDFNTLLYGMIASECGHIANIIGALGNTVFEQFFPVWPWATRRFSLAIQPVVSIDAVEYVADGVDDHTYTPVDPGAYNQAAGDGRGGLWFVDGFEFPAVEVFDHQPIRVTYTAGYGVTAAEWPPQLRQALYVLVNHFFVHREPMAAQSIGGLGPGMQSLLDPYVQHYRDLGNVW